ncbi:MAG: LuxR C-terminal-related transcriptional regulator [Chloroflexi bacterium]|nr:LuxR C-terminal-related transcriptional regulator [Chloroflexota bacterium]
MSKRENEVLDLLVQGMSNKKIALQACLSEKTVEKHIANIYRKIEVHSRTEAVLWVLRQEDTDRVFSHKIRSRDFPHRKDHEVLLTSGKKVIQQRRILMKKLNWIIGITAGIFVSVIAIGMGITRILTETQSISATSKMDDVLNLILNSHSKWSTVRGEAEITWYGPIGRDGTQTYIYRFVIDQPLSAYVDGTNRDEPGFNDNELWISDGTKTYDLDKENKTYTENDLPRFASDLLVMPQDLSDVLSDVVYNHPFSLIIPAPVKEYIYPEWFAQGNPTTAYTLIGEENLLGRNTWIVNLKSKTGQATAWIDQSTGMILKHVQEENGQKFAEATFASIEIDVPVDAKAFTIPPEYRPTSSFDY